MTNIPIDQSERTRATTELNTTFLVEAAAGTGKTTLAVERLLQAVRTGRATMEQIVAITFTEKAAAELKIRLRDSMEKARRKARGEERTRFDCGIRELERSHINTIHGFCSWLLKERPIEAQVDPGFQVMDELSTQLLQEETWDEWFDQQMERPPEVLKRVLFADIGPADLRKIAFEIVHKRDRLDMAHLTSSARSVAEAVAELGGILKKLEPKLANCIDRSDAAYERLTELLDTSRRLGGLPAHRQEFELIHSVRIKKNAGAQKNWNPKDTLKEIKKAYESINAIPARRCGALLRDAAAWLKGFAGAFERAKALRGVLDFDDLLIKTRNLLRSDHSVRAAFQRRFKVVLVDEFQDTDPIQAEIVFFLAENGAKAERWDRVKLQPGKLFLVGDPKQSIYRFRRADIEIYEQAKTIVARQGEVLTIRQSFRTVSPLIAWVNFTFEQLIHPPDDGGSYQPRYVPLEEWPNRHEMSPRVCVLEPTEEERARIEAEKHIEVVRAIEAREIARLIEHLVRSGEWKVKGKDDAKERAPRYSDFAILLHSPQTSLAAYETALQQQGIRYQVEGGKDYFQGQEVRMVCALLLALDDPTNARELVGVLRSAAFGFSDEEIFLFARENALNYLSVPTTPSRIAEALGLLRKLHEARNQHSFAGLLELLFAELKLPELFSLKPHGEQHVANLMKLLSVARRVQDAGLLSLREFVNYLRTTALDRSEEGQSPSAERDDDVVKVLSIHKAKGLEWSIVIVGDLGGTKRPHPPILLASRDTREFALRLNSDMKTGNYDDLFEQEKLRQQAEEKRLLYVAATRARDYLVLPWFAPHGHYMNVIREAFDPAHAGETISSFFQRNASESRVETAPREPIRVDLGEPGKQQRAPIERLLANRVEWLHAHEAALARANTGKEVKRPSELAGGEGRKTEIAIETVPSAHAERAALFGTLMHEVLAEMDFKQPELALTAWRIAATEAGLDEREVKRGTDMLQRFARTKLFERIRNASEIHREMPFAFQRGEMLMEGVMDVVFKEGDRWSLVDYKTDQIRPEEVAGQAEHYRPQLQAYGEALEILGGIRPAKILVFLGPAVEVPIDA